MNIKLCTPITSIPTVPLDTLVERIYILVQAMSEKSLFMYQGEFSRRIIESLLLHQGDMLTALWCRQSGKSETIGTTVSACALVLPSLAKAEIFLDDWRLNCTDEQGSYRGYKNGLKVGIYAPKQEQADVAFTRVKDTLETDTSQRVAEELGVGVQISNSNKLWMSNGSKIRSQSASEQSKIEGESYHLLLLDEAQDIGSTKVKKSIHPMVAAYNGLIAKIGTCSTEKSDFYTSIKTNKRLYAQGGPKNHYEYNYLVCQKYNSMYRDFIEKEKVRLGEDSDEFKLSYSCAWLLERGQFITDKKFLSPEVAMVSGGFHKFWPRSPRNFDVVAGIDFGKVHDPTVVVVVAVDWKTPIADEWIDTLEESIHFTAYQKHIIAWDMILGDNYEEQFSRITEFLSSYKGLRKITLDATGVGQWGHDKFAVHYANFERGLGKDGTPDCGFVEIEGFNFTAPSKSEGYKLLHADLTTGRMTYPAGEEIRKTVMFRRFVGEMLDLRKTYRNGYMCCEAPNEPGSHDDYCSATMLANWGAQTPSDLGTVEVGQNYMYAR